MGAAADDAAASAQVKARCPIYQGNQGRGPLRVTGLQESTPHPAARRVPIKTCHGGIEVQDLPA
jgi:hypothetical protein